MSPKHNLYGKIRSFLPHSVQGFVSKVIFWSGLKPSVSPEKSPFNKGIITFSADFEMAWAFRYSKTKHADAVQLGLNERKNLPEILDLFNKHNIPVTWATVGHLFLKECHKNDSLSAHHNMPRPEYFENKNWEYKSGDWYDHDPCKTLEDAPAWYANDLIEMILRSKVKHEIGCHTFSHADFTYQHCAKILAEAELDECIQLASAYGIKLKSMVFPGGTLGNYETVKSKGFMCYRKPMKYHIALPVIDQYGLVAVPSTLGLDKDPYGWSKDFHISMIQKFIKAAIKSKKVCHFWFHPSINEWYLKNVLPLILDEVSLRHDSGQLEIMTMGQVAENTLIR